MSTNMAWRVGIGIALTSAVAMAACSSSDPASPTTTPPTTSTTSVTYYKDVKPILDAKCTGCHVDGGIAPFSLTTANEAIVHKSEIASVTKARIMPPWPPAAGCTEYLGDRSMSDAEIATLGDWARLGAATGSPQDFVAPVGGTSESLSRVDLNLKMPTAFTPTTRPDEYRCFMVDWPETQTKFVTGFGAIPGQPQIVHHVLVFISTPDEVASYQALDDADATPGWECFAGPGGSSVPNMLGAWVPGVTGKDLPAGTGVKIAAGSKLIVQVHYNTLNAPPAADTTTLQVKVDDTVAKEAFVMPWTNPSWVKSHTMPIAAGAPDTSYTFSYDAVTAVSLKTGGGIASGAPFTVYSAALHMHLHGTHAELAIERAAGASECMLSIPAWNFHWQGSYSFATPKQVQPGDKLSIECHWDNTQGNQPSVNGVQQPPQTLNWGEATTDEMCLGFFYITQ